MTAAERFKAMFANAIERVCVLEEQLEAAQAQIKVFEAAVPEADVTQPKEPLL